MTENPRVVVMPPLGRSLTRVWCLLLDLAEAAPEVWCLIGGLMVALHGLEHGRSDARPSADGDVLVDVRADPTALRRITDFLIANSMAPDPAPDGIVHRFKGGVESDQIVIDVLAPDNVGSRADLTTAPPGRTIQVPGGTQALNRMGYVHLKVEDRIGRIPRPSLLAAIVAKASAVNLPGNSERHYQDLAFLLALMPDPLAVRQTLTRSDRRRLRNCALNSRDHRAWQHLSYADANAGHAALRLLNAPPGGRSAV